MTIGGNGGAGKQLDLNPIAPSGNPRNLNVQSVLAESSNVINEDEEDRQESSSAMKANLRKTMNVSGNQNQQAHRNQFATLNGEMSTTTGGKSKTNNLNQSMIVVASDKQSIGVKGKLKNGGGGSNLHDSVVIMGAKSNKKELSQPPRKSIHSIVN